MNRETPISRKPAFSFCWFAALFGMLITATAAGAVFSGPQPGERTTAFKVLDLTNPNEAKERDPITENAGAPTSFVFVHAIERSLVPLLREVDRYGAEQKDRLKTEVVFLATDRLEGEQRAKAAIGSLRLQSRVGLSLDGIEGPGNYGLNKQCMITIIAAKDNEVTANFALTQPGIADAPKVLEALARTCGDPNPPTAEQINERQMARGGASRMQPDRMTPDRTRPQPVDFSKFDLNSEAGLRDAGRALIAEVQSLRKELTTQHGANPAPARPEAAAKPRDPLPGAAPTDVQLISLLRAFIQPKNEDATVDKVLSEVEAYVKGNPDLTKQAIDGWVRVLAIPYGTAYAQKAGAAFVEKLKSGSR